MTNNQLKPCPCGKIPERLIVHAEHSCPKWAWVTGSCCDGWGLEPAREGHPRWNVAEVHEWMRARRDERVLRRKAA